MNNTMKNHIPGVFRKICWIGAYKGEHVLGKYICNALKNLGFTVEVLDYRENIEILDQLFPKINADLVIISRGGGIPPQLIEKLSCPTVLWFGEVIHGDDENSRARLKELEINSRVFDYVVWGAEKNPESMQLLRNLGCSRVNYAYPCRFDPNLYQKLNVEKKYDVGFVGSITQRRKYFLDKIAQKFNLEVKNIWSIAEQVRFFNECKIVLHINSFDFINIAGVNLRAFDVMGCGSMVLHEDVVYPSVFGHEFEDGKHLAYWQYNDADDLLEKIGYYLKNEKEREQIAGDGFDFVHSYYTVERTMEELLNKVQYDIKAGTIGAKSNGYYDKWGRVTDSKNTFYKAVEQVVSPSYASSYYERGKIYFELKLWNKARTMLEQSVNRDRGYVDALFLLALTYLNLDMDSLAIQQLHRVLKEKPLHKQAHQLLGDIYMQHGDDERGSYYQLKGEKLFSQKPSPYYKESL